jgi:tRNA(Ile2) C34 agmatinyltransferase TiaS
MSATRAPVCHDCGSSLGGRAPRLFIAGQWRCPDCVYENEYRKTERIKRRRAAPFQEERLFPLPPPLKGQR